MSANVEHGVIVRACYSIQPDGLCQRLLRGCVALEPGHRVGLIFWEIALGIDRWLSAVRRRGGQLHSGTKKHIVGSSEFLEPKAGLAAGVSKLIVRGQDHHDSHL